MAAAMMDQTIKSNLLELTGIAAILDWCRVRSALCILRKAVLQGHMSVIDEFQRGAQ
jgi:hypothetical protein